MKTRNKAALDFIWAQFIPYAEPLQEISVDAYDHEFEGGTKYIRADLALTHEDAPVGEVGEELQNDICGIVSKYGVEKIYDATDEILHVLTPYLRTHSQQKDVCIDCGSPMMEVCSGLEKNSRESCGTEMDKQQKDVGKLVEALETLEKLGTCWQGQGVMGSQMFIMGTAVAVPCREALAAIKGEKK